MGYIQTTKPSEETSMKVLMNTSKESKVLIERKGYHFVVGVVLQHAQEQEDGGCIVPRTAPKR